MSINRDPLFTLPTTGIFYEQEEDKISSTG